MENNLGTEGGTDREQQNKPERPRRPPDDNPKTTSENREHDEKQIVLRSLIWVKKESKLKQQRDR